MAMESVNLLPSLQGLPGEASDEPKSRREFLDELVRTDAAFHAADMTTANSFALWGIFDDINVDDNIQLAYEMQYPGEAARVTVHDKWLDLSGQGDANAQGLVSGIKGKLAELQTAEQFEQRGFENVTIAESATQPGWDISAVSPGGDPVLIQVKMGAEGYADKIQNSITESGDVDIWAVSDEMHVKFAETIPQHSEQLENIGSNLELIADVKDGLETLSDNMGIDVTDGVGDIIPYASAVIASARLIYSVIRTEQQFKAADRTTRNKIQVVQTLTLMSRMGVSTVLAMAGGKGGALAASVVPGVGTAVGGVAGSVAGAGIGIYLNRHLQPRMLDIALDITELTHDDLFYYKNRERVEELAESLQRMATALENVGEDTSEFPAILANAR